MGLHIIASGTSKWMEFVNIKMLRFLPGVRILFKNIKWSPLSCRCRKLSFTLMDRRPISGSGNGFLDSECFYLYCFDFWFQPKINKRLDVPGQTPLILYGLKFILQYNVNHVQLLDLLQYIECFELSH